MRRRGRRATAFGVFFASLSPPFIGKTKVTRELDEVGPSTLSNADRPRPRSALGTPVRWEGPSIVKAEEQFHFTLLTSAFMLCILFDCKVISVVTT
jgi:hypothetical protein